MDFLEAAFHLCSFGWKVFPLVPGEKVPAIPKKEGGRGVLDATDDEDTIAAWARRFPDANIGVACGEASGILVVDVDTNHGGVDALRELLEEGKRLPASVTVRTANGGFHLYFRYVAGPKNSKSLLAKGVDIRTSGGYVVAPPSRLTGGRTYSWKRPPLGSDLPDLPLWAIEKLRPRERTPFYREPSGDPGDLTGLIEFLKQAPEGERNAILFWTSARAGEMIGRGEISLHEARAQIASAAASIGLSQSEISKSLESGLRAGTRSNQ